MKILVSGSFWHGSLEESYARAFESIGWDVIRFDWDRLSRDKSIAGLPSIGKIFRKQIADRVGKLFVARIRETQPDIVFVIKGRWIAPNTLYEAKKQLSDRPIINFNPDSPWEKTNSSKRLLDSISSYDFHFIWNSRLKEHFKEFGAKMIEFLPFAYDPNLHYPLLNEPKSPVFDLVFVGTYSDDRDKLLSELAGCNIGIWGNGWEQSSYVPKDWLKGAALYGEESTRLLDLAPAALNVLRPQNTGSHNMRTFEIPATRHAMLTTRSAEQALWLEEGLEMECYAGPQELLEKIRIFHSDPGYAQQIADAGLKRVKEETYSKRARQLLRALGFAS